MLSFADLVAGRGGRGSAAAAALPHSSAPALALPSTPTPRAHTAPAHDGHTNVHEQQQQHHQANTTLGNIMEASPIAFEKEARHDVTNYVAFPTEANDEEGISRGEPDAAVGQYATDQRDGGQPPVGFEGGFEEEAGDEHRGDYIADDATNAEYDVHYADNGHAPQEGDGVDAAFSAMAQKMAAAARRALALRGKGPAEPTAPATRQPQRRVASQSPAARPAPNRSAAAYAPSSSHAERSQSAAQRSLGARTARTSRTASASAPFGEGSRSRSRERGAMGAAGYRRTHSGADYRFADGTNGGNTDAYGDEEVDGEWPAQSGRAEAQRRQDGRVQRLLSETTALTHALAAQQHQRQREQRGAIGKNGAPPLAMRTLKGGGGLVTRATVDRTPKALPSNTSYAVKSPAASRSGSARRSFAHYAPSVSAGGGDLQLSYVQRTFSNAAASVGDVLNERAAPAAGAAYGDASLFVAATADAVPPPPASSPPRSYAPTLTASRRIAANATEEERLVLSSASAMLQSNAFNGFAYTQYAHEPGVRGNGQHQSRSHSGGAHHARRDAPLAAYGSGGSGRSGRLYHDATEGMAF